MKRFAITDPGSLLKGILIFSGFILPGILEPALAGSPFDNSSGKVISFSLIDADADKVLMTLLDGHTINLARLPTKHLNIRANVDPAVAGSVVMVLNGSKRIENIPPYAAKSDANGDYSSWTPPLGNNQVTATPFSGANGTGAMGEALSIMFSIVNNISRPQLEVMNHLPFSFLLNQGESGVSYFTLESSDHQTLPTPCAITAIDDATNDTPGWVAFPSSVNQGVGQDFFVNTIGLSPGIYTATVIFGPVQGYDDHIIKVQLEVSGVPLPFLSFDPDILNLLFPQGHPDDQAFTDYTVIASDGNESGAAVVIGIDQSTNQPASWLSFSSASNFNTPYSVFVDTDMPAGTYHATLFSDNIETLSGKYKNAKAEMTLVLTEAFKIASLVLINADNDQFMRFLFDGSVINLATLPTNNLNIQARTYPEVTGSVLFEISNVSRVENVFPYAAFSDINGDYAPWTPDPGTIQIKATPFSHPKRQGAQGESMTINITVLGPTPSVEQERLDKDSVQGLQLKTYPNPSNEEFFIELKSSETLPVALDIYNTTSAYRVFEGITSGDEVLSVKVDASRWANGIYYVRVVTGNGAISRKLVVNK